MQDPPNPVLAQHFHDKIQRAHIAVGIGFSLPATQGVHVVEDNRIVAFFPKQRYKVAAKEAASAGNQDIPGIIRDLLNAHRGGVHDRIEVVNERNYPAFLMVSPARGLCLPCAADGIPGPLGWALGALDGRAALERLFNAQA